MFNMKKNNVSFVTFILPLQSGKIKVTIENSNTNMYC